MIYRKLRIAWSVAWGIACLLLSVLWVRSYWYMDSVVFELSHTKIVYWESFLGRVRTNYHHHEGTWDVVPSAFGTSIPDHWQATAWPHFEYIESDLPAVNNKIVLIPYWFLAAFACSLAAVPWITRRFSLRTLLIGMTVAAIGLGWIVYAIRN